MQDYQTISLDDINKEKESSIKEIKQNKTNLEKEISNVVDKLDDTLEELEKSYNSNLESVSKSLKKSVNIFGDKAKKIKEGFLGVYVIIIIIVIYLVIEIISNYNGISVLSNISVLSYSLTQILSLSVPSIALILILGLVFKVYKNIRSIDNSSEINEEINNIDKNIVSVLDIPHYPLKIEVEKSFFEEKKAILCSIISSVGKVIPVVENIYDEVNLLVEYQQIVNDFESCLEFYNLVEDNESIKKIGTYAPADAHILNDKDLWKKIVAQKIVSQLNMQKIGQKFTFSENILLLLYAEHNDEQSTSVFREMVGSDNEIQMLALILIYSQKLTKSNDCEYKKEDIAAIIRNIDSFSLSNVNNILSNLLINRRRLIKSFKLCLEFYKIIENDKFFEEIGNYVSLDIYIKNDENLWEEITARKICSVCSQTNMQTTGSKFIFSENLLLLLFYEYNGEPTENAFNRIVHSENETQLLASILIHSQKLTKSNDYEYKNKNIAAYDYKNEDIAAIIKQVKPFSLSSINDVLSDSFLTLKYLKSYVEFLVDNNIEISYEPTIEYIINKSKDISFEKRVVNLAYNLGIDNFNKINGLNEDFIDGFARASVTLKFHDDLSLRDEVCKCSSKDYSTAILWCYFEKIKENDGQKIVLISELINNKEKVTFFLNKLEDPELKDLKFFQTQLKEGQWYDSSFSLLRKFFDDSREEIVKELSNFKEKLSNLEDYEILKNSIQSNFQEVSIGTIEKLIDAKFFGAYVIMFNSGKSQNPDKNNEGKINEAKKNEEKLRKIIDNLSKRDLDQSGDNKWKFKEEEKIIKELPNTCGLRPKYDFINFSHSTRIGILDRDQSFQEFKKEFLDDVRTILNSKEERFNVGVVVLKIMPSTYSFGTLDNEGTSDNIQIKELDTVKYIARLASTKLSLEDQVGAMRFEKNIDLLEIVNEQSFYEVIGNRNDDIKNKKEIKILSEPELTNGILKELNEKMSIESFRSLALDLKEKLYGKEDIDRINKTIELVLKQRYLNEDGLKRKADSRPRILAQRFTNSLTNLASLYKLQRGN